MNLSEETKGRVRLMLRVAAGVFVLLGILAITGLLSYVMPWIPEPPAQANVTCINTFTGAAVDCPIGTPGVAPPSSYVAESWFNISGGAS